jgi:MFS family permease
MCASKSTIGFLGSCILIGWTCGLCFVPRLTDKFGRKKIALIMLSLQLVAYALILFPRNILFTCFLAILIGMAAAGRWTSAYIYLLELIPPSRVK